MGKLTITLVLVITLLITFLMYRPALADAGWNIQTVDSVGDVGANVSLALDAAGNAHISYLDSTNGNLKYASWNSSTSAWDINTVDSSGDVGFGNTSLALDSAGNAHIGYFDSTNYELKYTAWNSSTSAWDINTVDSGGYDASLALDSADNPHISYCGDAGLKYAAWNSSTSAWDINTVDSSGDTISLALDSADNAHISYCGDAGLEYAAWNSSTSAWDINTVDNSGGTWNTSLALDATGNPHISYSNYLSRDLKYAAWNNSTSSWDIQAVVAGANTCLALDSAGNPHISYYDNDEVKYAAWNSSTSTWDIQTVDSVDMFGTYTSLALDSADNAHIAYYGTNNDLKYAVISDQGSKIWYVDNDALSDPGPGDPETSDPNENGSVEHPFDAIQEGINAAFDGDTVIVLQGTFTGTGNRDIDFLGKAITVRSTEPNDTAVVAATIIDCQGDPNEPHRGFYFHSGEGANSVLNGLTITNGSAGHGGGIYCENSSPTLTNCTFSGNTATSNGGGMLISSCCGKH